MSIATRSARATTVACLVAATLLAGIAGPAAALEPPRPLPGYRPAFVTETDTRPWNDCLWASAAMLLDKWTNGRVTPTRQKLRALSRDHRGGSSLDDLQVAFGKLGFKLRFSPDGGERITWPGLLRRLQAGAGAVLLGDDSDLPRWYGRWDYGFWRLTKKEKAAKDNHAVYIERYDRKRGRVWLMDPLARGDWKGEWISVWALRRFAWSTGGALSVAVTPTARAAPFTGVTLAPGKVSLTPNTLAVSWGIRAPRSWRYPGADLLATFQPATDPITAATLAPSVVARASKADAPAKPVATVAGKQLRASVALPTKPGAWLSTLTLTDRRFGGIVVRSEDVAVYVPGPRRATLRLNSGKASVVAGATVPISLSVANTGEETWAEPARPAGAPAAARTIRDTRVVARWVPIDVPAGEGTGDAAELDVHGATELRAVPLSPGRILRLKAQLVAPEAPGQWALVIDLVDDVDGSFAALGSAPAVHVFEIVAPRGIVPVD
jgi:hypothetical protein